MYSIKRTKGSLPVSLRNTIFKNYELARRAVRKYLRDRGLATGNTAISLFGFSIQRTT